MKKRITFVCIIIALLIAGAWWLLTNKLSIKNSPHIIPSNSLPHGANPAISNMSQSNVSQTNRVASAPNPIIPSESNPKVLAMIAIWTSENAKSQDFYGKIIDQNGQVIADAEVTGELGWIQGMTTGPKTKSFTTKTDARGEFQFVGIAGWQLGVIPKKQGYQLARNNDAKTMPSSGKTSPSSRAIFTMWKLKGPEPMIHTKINASLACNGTPRSFDVVNARRDAGNLMATYSRSPLNIEKSPTFDYNLTLGMKGGGLIEIKDLYPNEAPSDGYQPVSVAMRANDPSWTSSLDRSYYFCDGKNYGRLALHLQANYPPPSTHFTIEAFVNPSGSRNLEYDREKSKAIESP